jgi:hypothetical protein
MASNIKDLRKWRNGEIFNARDYVYERDLLINALGEVEAQLQTIEYQKIFFQDEEPQEDVTIGDIWFDS